MPIAGEVDAVAERVGARLAVGDWDLGSVGSGTGEVSAAAEVAVFALKLAGKRRQARRGGRFGRLVVRFALAACVALASAAAACDKPDASPEATQVAISQLPADTAATATITAQPRAGPAQFADLLLVDAGSDAQPWALMVARGGDLPILVDRVGAGLDTVGGVYRMAAQPVTVGTRDGPSQFLDPLQPAEATGSDPTAATSANDSLTRTWGQDERYLATTRAIAGHPTALDAAYNAAAATTAGGTHTYTDGVVLRVEPDQPVLQVIDRALLESGRPTRAEDVVYVAIRAGERSLYEPGQVVNLDSVVMDKQTTDVDGQPTTVYVANAALDGARVEPTGTVDLQSLLQPRLQRVDQDVASQAQEVAASTPGAASTPAPQLTATPGAAAVTQPIIVQQRNNGPSFVDDFLIYMWLSNSGWYRGSTVIINNPPSAPYRSGGNGVLYSAPPSPSGSSPSTIASSQAASRSTALQAARGSVSGQASGTGGGVAATNKSAADASAHVSAATSKSASVAGAVSASSAGKSVSSAPSGSSSTASRSAGSTSAGSRGSVGSSSSSSSSGGKSSGSSGGFGSSSSSSSGGKGISGSSSGSSSS